MVSKIRDKPREKRPDPTEPIDMVIDCLNDLTKRIDKHQGKDRSNNMLEKYDYFCYHAELGRACTYAIQSKRLFLVGDWQDTQRNLLRLLEAIRMVPGYEDFGK